MTHNDFTYEEILKSSWGKTKEHFWFMMIMMAIYTAIAIITFPLPIISQISSMLLGVAIMTVTLVVANNATPEYKDLTKSLKSASLVLHYFIASIIYAIIVIIGFIALILPGVYLMTRLQFFTFVIIENENTRPIDALKKSWKLTEGIFWKTFGFTLLSIAIILISIIPFGLGLVFSIPLITISYAMFYKKLAHRDSHHHEKVESLPHHQESHHLA